MLRIKVPYLVSMLVISNFGDGKREKEVAVKSSAANSLP
jgi:hypothetical protein